MYSSGPQFNGIWVLTGCIQQKENQGKMLVYETGLKELNESKEPVTWYMHWKRQYQTGKKVP